MHYSIIIYIVYNGYISTFYIKERLEPGSLCNRHLALIDIGTLELCLKLMCPLVMCKYM